MDNTKTKKTSSHTKTTPPPSPYGTTLLAWLLVVGVGPVVLAVLLFRADGFDPAPIPDHAPWSSLAVPMSNRHILAVSEKLGDGLLPGPEDLAYDADEGVIYTGCDDGWIKKVAVAGEEATVTVENWAYVGGRPLGVALGVDKQLIVADSYKGLLRVTREGAIDLLTDEADQVKFRLTDGVDVARNGMIYFTDASYKYNLGEYMLDHLEGRPHGRLMSFDPQTNLTQVLLHDLHFANGLALSPHHDFLVFCETLLRRCRKYHIQGERKGSVEDFIDNLPGYPDNIKYDGDGHFWIALPAGRTFWNILMQYPIVRKAMVILDRFVKVPHVQKGAGVLSVSLEGQAIALYSDPALAMVTGGMKIGRHLYYGSLVQSFIGRLDLTQHAARAA